MPDVLRALAREVDLKRGRLSSLTLELTYRCNLRCAMCGTWAKHKEATSPELTCGELTPIIREARDLGASELTLVGAEPATRSDLVEIILRGKQMGYSVHVVTNGTLISASLAEELVGAGLDRVTVSVDGPPSVHDRVRGRDGVFAKAEEGIANLLKARRSSGSGAPAVGIHCTITSINADSIAEMPAVAKRLGVEALSLQLVSVTSEDEVAGSLIDGSLASGREFVCDGQAILPSLEQAGRIRAFAKETSGEWFSSQLALLASMSPEEISQGRFPVRACSVIRRDLIVDPYGLVLPCSHLGEYPLGDLRRQSVADVWNGDRRKRLLRTIGKELLPVCAKCCHHPPNLTLLQKGMLYLETRGGRP